jgi:ankyrin repeat protein
LVIAIGTLLGALIVELAGDRRARLAQLTKRVTQRTTGLARTALRPPAARIVVFFAVLALVTRSVAGCARGTDLARAVHQGKGAVLIAVANHPRTDPAYLRGPLFEAASTGDPDIIGLLLDRGAPAGARLPDGSLPLHFAARFGHPAASTLLAAALTSSKDPAARAIDFGAGPRIRTALHDAVVAGSAETVTALLRAGAVPDRPDLFGETPLHLLAFGDPARTPSIAARLLEAGANPAAVDARGFTPLHAAAAADNVALVDAIAGARPELVALTTPVSETSLDVALRYGRDRAAEALLEHGSPLGSSPGDGHLWPPLHAAARMDAAPRAATLLAAGADVGRVFQGRTALDVARAFGSKRVEALLRSQEERRP